MNKQPANRLALASFAVLVSFFAGCASVAVSNDAIEQNTASTLGLAKGSFTISDRVDSGVKTSYTVKTNTNKQYACYVTGTMSVMGRNVSDAICTETAAGAKPAGATAPSGSCNALLKAAGKC